MAVLKEVMRKREDFNFSLLNKICKGETDKHMIKSLFLRFARDRIQISHLILKIFHFKQMILNLGNKFAQKGYFSSKTEKVNISIEFCIF